MSIEVVHFRYDEWEKEQQRFKESLKGREFTPLYEDEDRLLPFDEFKKVFLSNREVMTLQELQQDKLKRRREVLNAILAEFEEFGIDCSRTISKNDKGEYDYGTVNLRVLISPFFFDFRFDLDRDELVLNAYTNKQLTNNGGVVRYPLTMANIDELLMAMKSYENVYVPKFE